MKKCNALEIHFVAKKDLTPPTSKCMYLLYPRLVNERIKLDEEILCTGSQHMYFLKWIMADNFLGPYQTNVKSWAWGGGGGREREREIIDEYGNQTQENMKGQSRSSMPTFVGLPHMYVPDILHDT